MKCHSCGQAEMHTGIGTHEYRAAGLPYPVVLVGVGLETCPACGEQVVTIPNPEALHHQLALGIVQMERPMLAQEVRFLRKLLDRSSEEMAALMGVDAKTLSRWENGRQKMGKVAERLLRLMVHQRLAPKAAGFAESVFPKLRELGAATAVRFATSSTGWRQAA